MRDFRYRLTPTRFRQFTTRTLFAIVRVDRASSVSLMPGLTEYFDKTYDRLFSFGGLSRSAVRDAFWWDEHFQTTQGPVRGGVVDGYYLFESGYVVGQHRGQIGGSSSFATPDIVAERQRIGEVAFDGMWVSDQDLDSLHRIVTYFEEIVGRKMRAQGFGDDGRTSSAPEPEPYAPPARAVAAPAADDPFALLGLEPSATLDEVKAAWKQQMKLNHPDRVAHMSPALQQFAHAQTLAIQKAYEAITAMRRG